MDGSYPIEKITRRALLQTSGLALLGAPLLESARAASSRPAGAGPKGAFLAYNRFPRLVQEYCVERVRDIERRANERRAALRTKADAEAYVRDVRDKISQCFGPWPEKTPLNPRITGVLDRDAYVVEKLIFESRPGFLVTGNLYVPKGRAHRMPGVIAPCGHYLDSKAHDTYQSFAQGLARQGYVTLIYDPVGQGERLQYPDAQLQSRYGGPVQEHQQAGVQQNLVGEFFGAWRAWDGIRALDYLLSRPEVDPAHVGVTGNSGGGTETAWLCGLDPRLTMAAPECFISTFRRILENETPGDSEQCPPRALSLGLDHSDFVAAMAPKPVILIGQEKDFFDARALEEAYGRLQGLYRLLGAEENIALAIKSDYHAYTQPSREAMYGWFNRVTGVAAGGKEPALKLETEEALRCTPKGQVSELGSRTVFSFTREKSLGLARSRPRLAGAELKEAVAQSLRMPALGNAPDYRILRPKNKPLYRGKYAAAYFVETEEGVGAIVYRLNDAPLISRPPRGQKHALLYVCHQSSDAELRHDSWLGALVDSEPGAVFTCDPRGVGESRPNTCGSEFASPYGSDYFYAAHGLMLDAPYVGQKTFDVLRVLALLKSCGHEEIHLAAAGWGTLPATFAALLCDEVRQVSLKGAPESYSKIAETEDYAWPLSTFVPGVLRSFDLPDCYVALTEKNLSLRAVGAGPAA